MIYPIHPVHSNRREAIAHIRRALHNHLPTCYDARGNRIGDYLSTKELSKILGVARKALTSQANKGYLRFIIGKERGGGGHLRRTMFIHVGDATDYNSMTSTEKLNFGKRWNVAHRCKGY